MVAEVVAELSDPVVGIPVRAQGAQEPRAGYSNSPHSGSHLWEPFRGDRTLATWVTSFDLCRDVAPEFTRRSHKRIQDPRIACDYKSLAEDGVDSALQAEEISERMSGGLVSVMAAGRPHGALTLRARALRPARLGHASRPNEAPLVPHYPRGIASTNVPAVGRTHLPRPAARRRPSKDDTRGRHDRINGLLWDDTP
jgi:hypothetical protein